MLRSYVYVNHIPAEVPYRKGRDRAKCRGFLLTSWGNGNFG